MKIVCLRAENYKRLTAVEIRPNGNVVEIAGKNGSGKSSTLDSIWAGIAGKAAIPSQPIRKGANEARIVLDLGELVVTRTFKAKDGSFTTSIKVESADGGRFGSPQTVLDALMGELSFDPLAFTRMDAKAQFDALKRFVPGVDFEQIERLNKADFDKRTDLNRDAKRLRAEAGPLPETAPAERIDESALAQQLEQAATHNAEIERERADRDRTEQMLARALSDASGLRARAAELRRQADELEANADGLERKAGEGKAIFDGLPPLANPIDAATVRKNLDAAHAANVLFDQKDRHDDKIADAEIIEAQTAELTASMEKRNAEKLAAIAAAKMPIAGLGFGDEGITLNGVPFNQASDAEQLRASIAIAAAMNPRLKVIRVRDGSLLDEDSMTLLAEFCEANDVQCWIERVSSDGRVGFVLEDGHLKQPAMEAAE